MGSRVKVTPEPDYSFRFPKSMDWTTTAVPHLSFGDIALLREKAGEIP